MRVVKPIVGPFMMVICLLIVSLAGCGGDDSSGGGKETVYLYVANYYPGSSKMTIYGPTGKLASNLEFGSRTAEPVEVDRNTNSNQFQVSIDGAPTRMQLSKSLFSLYPQETATLVVSRRSGESGATASFFRHTRSPDPSCILTMNNSLSVENNFMPTELLSYSYLTEWNVGPKPMYDENRERLVSTRCGPTKIRDQDTRHDLHVSISNDPWFFPTEGGNAGGGDETYQLVWARRDIDPRTGEKRSEGVGRGGQIKAVRTTKDYLECLSGAVSIKQSDGGGGGGLGGLAGGGEQKCPDLSNTATAPNGQTVNVLGPGDVVWNEQAAAACKELKTYGGLQVGVGQSDSAKSLQVYPRERGAQNCSEDYDCSGGATCRNAYCLTPGAHDAGDLVCGSPIRIRTPFEDLVFQNVDPSIPGYINGEGGFIEVDATFPISEQHFFTVFGRPINAFVDQWNSEQTSASTGDGEFPYPADLIPTYAAGSDQ